MHSSYAKKENTTVFSQKKIFLVSCFLGGLGFLSEFVVDTELAFNILYAFTYCSFTHGLVSPITLQVGCFYQLKILCATN